MTVKVDRMRRWVVTTAAFFLLSVAAVAGLLLATRDAQAGPFSRWWFRDGCAKGGCCVAEGPPTDDIGGTWYWLRSPEEEKRVVMGLYNRYCIRCHGVNGRGVEDIPGVPNFTDVRWQASRSDGQIARIILEGRGAVMPPFRGALSLEEAWAMARYLRTFVPGTEVSRPDLGPGGGRPAAESKGP
jgi:mono/diheme cytochrome c family protein